MNLAPCNGETPAERFEDGSNVVFDLDRIVEPSGVSNGSNNHPMLEPGTGPSLRDGALNPNLSGPLGQTLIEKLTDPDAGVVLDSWIDADGELQGDASGHVE